MSDKGRDSRNGDQAAQRGRSADGRFQGDKPEAQLDEVRDILFGAQARETETRIQALEDRLVAEISKLGESLGSRVSDLEASMKSELGDLARRLDEERVAREGSDASLEREVRALGDSISARIDGLDAHGAGLTAEITAKFEELRETKADRSDLADFFAGFARKLTQRPPTGTDFALAAVNPYPRDSWRPFIELITH